MFWRFPHTNFRFAREKLESSGRNAASTRWSIVFYCLLDCLFTNRISKIRHYFHFLHRQLLEAEQLADYA